MLQALASDGPALLQVYAPSPVRHGFEPRRTLELSRLAVDSRTLPLFRYDPHGEGVFGSRISLGGNPAPDSPFVPLGDDGAVCTTAGWAFRQSRFANQFAPLRDDAPGPLPLHEWLQLDDGARDKKTPFVAVVDDDEERRFAVDRSLANVTAGCAANWQTLQELAGVVTPFTARVEADIRSEVAAEHQAELDAQKQAAEAEIKAIREQTQAEIAAQIRSRLLALASQKRS